MADKECMCDSALFDNFTADLTREIDQIKGNEGNVVPVEDYNKDTYWRKIGLCCELISKECTKMAVAFSKPPFPSIKNSTLLLKDVAKAVDMLLAWYKCFPITEGKLLHNILQNCILGILTAVGGFTDATLGCKSKSQTLISTGSVWENCDDFKKLPSDNTEVAIKHVTDSYHLITDAMDELEQALIEFEEDELNDIDDNSDSDDKWTMDDKKIFKPVNGLLMASKGLLKKIKIAMKKSLTVENNEIDELILNHANRISPCVDDFVLLMYPPVDRRQLVAQGGELSNTLSNTLTFLTNSSFGKEEENISWIEFIQKAVEHNLSLLKNIAKESS